MTSENNNYINKINKKNFLPSARRCCCFCFWCCNCFSLDTSIIIDSIIIIVSFYFFFKLKIVKK